MAPRPSFVRFGRYLLLHRLAVGGMAEVFLAIDPRAPGDRQLVVIKQIREDLCSNREFVDMFIDEVRVIDRLDHPGIVHMHEYGVVDGRSFIALEHVWGESLATLTRICADQQTRFPISAALYIASEIAAALDHAHTHLDRAGHLSPVIHRDVTLGNVVVSYQGDVKILDFGIAKAQGRLAETRAGHVKGTLGYLAPEQIRGEPVGPATDIYQLGVLLYHLVVGHPPLVEANDLELMKAIVNGRVTPPCEVNPDLPPAVEQLLLRAMALKPTERFRGAGALAEMLRQMIAPVYHEAQQRLASLMLRITGDRYQRQQEFIRGLLAGRKVEESGGSSLFEWAFNEAALETSSHGMAVETDHASLDAESTAVMPNQLLAELHQVDGHVDPPDTIVEESGFDLRIQRGFVGSSEFQPGEMRDEQTEDGDEVPEARPGRGHGAEPLGVPDLHEIETLLQEPTSPARVPKPVSGVFRSLAGGVAPRAASDERGSVFTQRRSAEQRRRDRDIADDLLTGDTAILEPAKRAGFSDEARALELELERGFGREEPRALDDDVGAAVGAALADVPASVDDLLDEPIHDQVTSPGLRDAESTVVVRQRRAALRAFSKVRSGPVAIEDAQTRLLELEPSPDEIPVAPRQVPALESTTDPGVQESLAERLMSPPDKAVLIVDPNLAAAVTAMVEAVDDREPAQQDDAQTLHRAPTAPSVRRQVRDWGSDQDPAAVTDWKTDASISVGQFRNRGARLFAMLLLLGLLALVAGTFLLNPSLLKTVRRAMARLSGTLDDGAGSPPFVPLRSDGGTLSASEGPTGADAGSADSAASGMRATERGSIHLAEEVAGQAEEGNDSEDSAGDAEEEPGVEVDAGRAARSPRVGSKVPPGEQNLARPGKHVLGSLRVQAGPGARIEYPGGGGQGETTLQVLARKARLRITVDDVVLDLQHEVVGDQIKFHVRSTPVLSLEYNGLKIGQTPKAMMLGKRFRVSLGAAERGTPIVVSLRYLTP
ncbi:MAG: serine/threonine-protein kinase [Pseudomonadota bacterium]